MLVNDLYVHAGVSVGLAAQDGCYNGGASAGRVRARVMRVADSVVPGQFYRWPKIAREHF